MTWINLSCAARREITKIAKRGPTPEQMAQFPDLYKPKATPVKEPTES